MPRTSLRKWITVNCSLELVFRLQACQLFAKISLAINIFLVKDTTMKDTKINVFLLRHYNKDIELMLFTDRLYLLDNYGLWVFEHGF